MNLVTHQTGPEGKNCKKLLIEEGMDIARELYLGIVLDRSVSQLVIMASTEGGVEIEKVAAETPEKILKEWIRPCHWFATFSSTGNWLSDLGWKATKLIMLLNLCLLCIRHLLKLMLLWQK